MFRTLIKHLLVRPHGGTFSKAETGVYQGRDCYCRQCTSLNDGAAALVMMSLDKAKELNMKPLPGGLHSQRCC